MSVSSANAPITPPHLEASEFADATFELSGIIADGGLWGELQTASTPGHDILRAAAADRIDDRHDAGADAEGAGDFGVNAPTVSKNTQQAGEQISRGNYTWNDSTLGQPHTLTYSFRESAVIMPWDTSGFSQFTAAQMAAAEGALDAWQDVSGLTFNKYDGNTYSNSGTILFGNYNSGQDGAAAFAFKPDGLGPDKHGDFQGDGDVWVNITIDNGEGDDYYDTFHYGWGGIMTHELGHALGLDHPGDYNAFDETPPTWDDDAEYIEDTHQYSVMSYFDADGTTGNDADHGPVSAGPMMDDIAAIQRFYGAPNSAFATATTYGFNNTTGRAWYGVPDAAWGIAFCAYDTGGIDTFDFSGFGDDQNIYLQEGRNYFSDVGGLVKNVSIYEGVTIENAKGGTGVDVIQGNNSANMLVGNDGNDNLSGFGGNDTLLGGEGADTMGGSDNDDSLVGGDGGDSIWGGNGADRINGGVLNSTGGDADTITGDGGADTIDGGTWIDTIDGGAGDDSIRGGEGNDILTGGTEADKLFGELGQDTLTGGDGNDTLDGGTDASLDSLVGGLGDDVYEYRAVAHVVETTGQGVDTVRLYVGNSPLGNDFVEKIDVMVATGLDAYGDSRANTITSGTGADRLFGNGGIDSLVGAAGNDTLDGGALGDRLEGGADNDSYVYDAADTINDISGIDVIQVNSAVAGNLVDLTDIDIVGIEGITASEAAGAINLTGNSVANVLTGNNSANALVGNQGDDTLTGGGGNDTLTGGDGLDKLDGGAATDTAIYASAANIVWDTGTTRWTVTAGTTESLVDIERVQVIAANYLLVDTSANGGFGSGSQSLAIAASGDTVLYATGYSSETLNVTVDALTFNAGAASTGLVYTMANGVLSLTMAGSSNMMASGNASNNTITGNDGANTLVGGGGADTVFGAGGSDLFRIEGGDLINDTSGADTVEVVGAVTGNLVDLSSASRAVGNFETIIAMAEAGAVNLTGASYANHMTGNASANTIRGLAGSDTILGADGNDSVEGGADSDSLDGGADNDTLLGGGGADTLIGGAGDDTLGVLAGRSIATGGADNDTLVVDWSATDDRFFTTALSTTADGYSGQIYWQPNGADGDHNNVQFTGIDRFDITVGGAADQIRTGAGRDTIDAGAGADTIWSGSGADDIDGGAGNDIWIADLSAVTANTTLDLTAASSNYTVGVNTGSVEEVEQLGVNNTEVFSTGSGNDAVTTLGGFFHDNIATNAGRDTVKVAGGRDLVALGGQTGVGDLLVVDWSGGPDDEYWTSALSSGADGYGGDYYWRWNGNDGDHNRVTFSGVERFSVTTANAADRIRTGDNADLVSARGGNDMIWTGAGADTIDGGANALDGQNNPTGPDMWAANKSAATAGMTIDLTAVSSTYMIGAVEGSVTGIEQLGVHGGESFATGAGADTVVTLGGFYHDFLITNAGADWVKVAGGRDRVEMGAQTGLGDVLELDWSAPGEEYWSTWLTNDTLNGTGYSGELYWRPNAADGAHNYVIFSGVERFRLTTGGSNDQLVGGDNADTLSSGGGKDIIWSGAGLDVIDGGANAVGTSDTWVSNQSVSVTDMVINVNTASSYSLTVGGPTASVTGIEQLGINDGNEYALITGSGNDTLTTHTGFFHDRMTTNAGADTVKVAGGRDRVDMGAHTGLGDLLIVDWSSVNEVFWNTWLTPTADGYSGVLYWRPNGNDGDHNRVDFTGVERFQVSTGGGDDQLVSGDNADTMSAGGGADIIWSGQGVDDINGGTNVAGSADIWVANKSAATLGMTLNLTVASSSYQIGATTGLVVGIEQLGINNADPLNLFSSGSGDDVITTTGGFFHDWIATNAGADSVKVAGGRDQVNMGGQTGLGDLLTVDWSTSVDENFISNPLTVEGGGTGYSGVYYWQNNGNDGAHNRVDFTGVERFNVSTGGGHDVLYTGDANDTVTSNAGNDTILSGKGIDVIHGGGGDDKWVADKSFASVAQAIVIDFRAGPATAYLGTGSVRSIEWVDLATGAGADVLTTTAGFFHDVITTNAGADTVTLFAGRDTVNMGAHGGAGDLLVVDWGTTADSFHTAWNTPTADGYNGVFFWVNNGNDGAHNRVDFSGVERFDVTMGTGHDRINTGDNADTVRSGGGNDTIRSGKGADIIVAGPNEMASGNPTGPDIWAADKSNATAGMTIDLNVATSTYMIGAVQGSVSGVEQLGWQGNAEFSSGAGDDVIVTQERFFHDFIDTNDGSDTVTVAGGRDIVAMGDQGAAGDTLILDWSASNDVFWSGTFTKPNNTGYSGVFYWLPNGNDGAHNRVDFSGVEIFDITMGGGSDLVVTGDGADSVRGGQGNDILNTGRGDDLVDAGAGDDHWIADKFYATDDIEINLQKTGFSTYMTSGAVRGVDSMQFTSGSGADKLTTGLGFLHDVITTRAGNDVVTIAAGRDVVDMGVAGGKGDRLIVDWSASADEFVMGGLTTDATGQAGMLFWKWNSNDGAHNRVIFSGVERFNIKLGTGGDNVTTGDGADTVAGGAGNDTLGGGLGDDRLFGGDDADNLNGGDDGDILDGGLGADALTGGLGGDTFAYSGLADSAVAARDVIADLDDVLDHIDVSGIDANTLVADDQKFTKVAAFTNVAGQLVVSPYDSVNNWTLVQGDVNGDGAADFAIQLTGDHDTFNGFVL